MLSARDGGDGERRIAESSHHEVPGREPRLRGDLAIRKVELGPRGHIEPHLADVTDDADDRAPLRRRAGIDGEVAADWVLAAEVLTRQRFVDNRHERRALVVSMTKEPALPQRNTDRFEVTGTDLAMIRV